MWNISHEDIIARMRFDNPWWATEVVPEVLNQRLRRDYFTPFEQLAVQKDPHRSVVLLGPRRVGKTVILHQFIGRQIELGTPATNLFYASVDTPIYTRQSLEQLLSLFRQTNFPDYTLPIYVIFDEVQYVKDWELQLKSLTDSYRKIRFIVSGSAAAALKAKSNESGAGRFTDFILPPLTFAEFLRFTGKEEALFGPRTDNGSFVAKNISELNKQFLHYLNFGGYPELALSEGARSNPERFIRTDILDKVLLRDLPSLYGISDTSELYNLFNMLAFNTGREVSLEQLSQGANVSKNTLRRYLEYLEAAFLIWTVERVDKTARTFQRSASFKVYVANPSLRSALFGPLTDDDERFGFVAETAVFSQWMHDENFKRCVRYARWDPKNKEVDIVYMSRDNQKPVWAVEVKWSDRLLTHAGEISGLTEFATTHPFIKDLQATSRTQSGQLRHAGHIIPIVPTAMYCYTVGKNLLREKLSTNGEDEQQPRLI
jgi:uncharacterized protein